MMSQTRALIISRYLIVKHHVLLSDICCENNSLNAESIVDQASSHLGWGLSDERYKVEHMYPMIDVDCDSDVLNVNVDVVREILRHPDPGSAGAREVAHNSRIEELKSNDWS